MPINYYDRFYLCSQAVFLGTFYFDNLRFYIMEIEDILVRVSELLFLVGEFYQGLSCYLLGGSWSRRG